MDGLRDAPSLPRLEILAWCFAIYLSLHLSLPNLPPYLPVFRVQILIQFAHQRKEKKKNPTRSHESIGVDRCQESDTSFYFSLVMYLSLLCFFFFVCFLGENGLPPPRLNPASCLFAASVSVPARPVNRVLTTKHSGRVFLGRLQLKPQLVDTS